MAGWSQNTWNTGSWGTGVDNVIIPTGIAAAFGIGSASTDLTDVTFTWTLETTNTSTNTGAAPSVIGTQSGAGPTGKTMTTYDFTSSLDSGTNVVSAGDTVQLGISADDATGNFKWYVTCVWEFDLS